jgi:heme-degrading monooxygenase HmoA
LIWAPEGTTQKVLVDMFIVPPESRASFLETSRTIQDILKTLPGFVEGFVYEKEEGDGRHNILTTAVWEDEKAFEDAKKTVATKLQALGLNPGEKMRTLNVQIKRGVYERRSY